MPLIMILYHIFSGTLIVAILSGLSCGAVLQSCSIFASNQGLDYFFYNQHGPPVNILRRLCLFSLRTKQISSIGYHPLPLIGPVIEDVDLQGCAGFTWMYKWRLKSHSPP